MSVTDYDPYSHEAMKDPYPLYAAMRKEATPHFMPKYNGWALARFQDIWDASTKVDDNCTFTKGQTPGQVLLGEPVPSTFMTMDAPEHRKWRGLIGQFLQNFRKFSGVADAIIAAGPHMPD